MTTERRLAVLGSPIEHSRSPALHRAAYAVLGLPWRYDRVRVESGGLRGFLAGLGDEWLGLSLTMPLKGEALPLLATRTESVEIAGAANTLLLGADGPHGFNTDIAGILGALRDHGVTDVDTAHVLGTGSTAASAFLAASRLGASRVLVSGRSPDGIAALERIGDRLGVRTEWRRYGSPAPARSDLVINTLPGDIDPVDVADADLGDVLMEVPYDPWPTPRAVRWAERGGLVVGGLEMLLHQAVEQVRVFVTGAEGGRLDRDDEVIAAMRQAVGAKLGD